ncbi:MAG TPA: hypothetical protein VK698_12920 [Kofleriaceae bacterium]|nr:hypothetical protein [Kofleriaceae bacterium]
MEGLYREAASGPLVAAPSRDGAVTLEVGPRHVRLSLGERQRLTVSGSAATWVRQRGRADHRRELTLGPARLWPARSFPTRGLAIWYEPRPGQVERLGGVRATTPFEPDALAGWRALDRLAEELARALAAHVAHVGAGLDDAGPAETVELGRGQHRVLLVDLGDRLVVYARPLFRERPRRALEVDRDGWLIVPGRGRQRDGDGEGDRTRRFSSRDQVSASGDRLRFTGDDGRDLASLWLPWIAAEDRQELARRLGELVDPAPPEPEYEPRTGPRPWVSGLGRTPLPYTPHARDRR